MRIYYDNIIFNLQSFGGISVYWNELIKRLKLQESVESKFIEIKNAQDKFGYFLSLGLVLMITLKAAINIGVSCGILPTKGLPLPFISYGGSSFVFDLVSVGILINIARTGEYP